MSEWDEYMAFLEATSAEVKTWPKGKGGMWLKYIGLLSRDCVV